MFWSALVTFILMKLIGLVLRGARYKDEILEIGDLAIHDEEAFPDETFASRTSSASAFETGRPHRVQTSAGRVRFPSGRRTLTRPSSTKGSAQ